MLLSPDGSSVYFQGTLRQEPAEVGPKTFIDKVAIKTGEKKRLFESDNNDVFESVATVIDPEAGRFIVTRESPTEIAQLLPGRRHDAHAADEEQGPLPRPDQRAEASASWSSGPTASSSAST